MDNSDLSFYFKKRGVEDRVIPNMLGWSDGWFSIPAFSKKGELTSVIMRVSPSIEALVEDRYSISPSPKSSIFVPEWPLLRKADLVYLVFGIFDALTLAVLRFPVISTLHGTTLDYNDLSEFRSPIYIVPDKGEEIFAKKLAAKLGTRGRPLILDYPDNAKDPNDFLLLGQKKNLMSQLMRK